MKRTEMESEVLRNDECESQTGLRNDERPKKKKCRHRHAKEQIQELEHVFKTCSHTDAMQREELSNRLAMEPSKVGFWFQNKRNQLKAHHEHRTVMQLKIEAEKLLAENSSFKESLANTLCPNCIGRVSPGNMSMDKEHLRAENARLREEIDKISAEYLHIPSGASSRLDLSMLDMYADERALALAAIKELVQMAQAGEPLWLRSSDCSTERLNEEAYIRAFPSGIWPKFLGVKSEASRESAVVMINPTKLVEILMDEFQWSSVFSSIVPHALKLRVMSTGVAGNFDGALQAMIATYQVSTPLVPCRPTFFLRYCKQLPDGTWAVVDVSLDNLYQTSGLECQKRPSGCLIQELPNGYSKVVWVEHVEIHDDSPVHCIYRTLVDSGLGFGAKRWVATLGRQCERLASATTDYIPREISLTPKVRKNMLIVAERMVMDFWVGVGTASSRWTTQSGTDNLSADEVMATTRIIENEPGRPTGKILTCATSFWIPSQPKGIFDYLRDVNSRSQWDILSDQQGTLAQEIIHIATGRDPGNVISLIRISGGQIEYLILQETITDSTGYHVIYAIIDSTYFDYLLGGGDLDRKIYALLPMGVAILPDGAGGNGGSLLTVSFQVLFGEENSVTPVTPSPENIGTIGALIKDTVERIKAIMP